MSPVSSTLLESCQEFVPASAGELRRFLQENRASRQLPVYPLGGRTSLGYGYPAIVPGTVVSLSRLTEIVDYPARDMTVTVEAGIRMDELAAALRPEGQQLSIDAAQSNRATLGGAVATNTFGPRMYGYGTLRDYVIGITAVDARGRLFHAGGRVVKNVAGYDLCKLMVGSLGTLAVITQVTLKLRPLPESASCLWATFPSFREIDDALEGLVRSEARPIMIEVLNEPAARQIAAESRQELPAEGPVLLIGLEGLQREVEWQGGVLKRELAPYRPREISVVAEEGTTKLTAAMTEFPTASDAPLSFQAHLLPSRTVEFLQQASDRGVSVEAHAGNGIVIGHLPDQAATVEQAEEIVLPLRELARRSRGELVILDCEGEWKERLSVFGRAGPGGPLMRRLKQVFDPQGILNPGRMWHDERGDAR